jgi:hypothetical protein
MTVASADTPNNSSSVAWCQRINWSRPPKRSAKALSKAGGNVVDSANGGHGAIGRFSNSVVVRDHVNANDTSGSASASANNIATTRSRAKCNPGAGGGTGGNDRESRIAGIRSGSR